MKATTDHVVILAYCRYYVSTEEFDRRLPGTVVRERRGRDESIIDPRYNSRSNEYARAQLKVLQAELDSFEISFDRLKSLKDYVLHLGYERQREYLNKYDYSTTPEAEHALWSPYPMGRPEPKPPTYRWEGFKP